MTAFSVHGRITNWIADEIEQQTLVSGDEYGYHATMALAQTPKGDAVLWVIHMTTRSPFLGEDSLGFNQKLAGNIPAEPQVRHAVRGMIDALRKRFEERKREGFQGNGHEPGLTPEAFRGKGVR
jgi:hypothetical protein